MISHNNNKLMSKKNIFWCFIILAIHAYYWSLLLMLQSLDNLNNKSKIKPFFGNGYRRKYETKNI